MAKQRKYFKNVETGDIYKESGDKFGNQYLKMTPWEEGEDRRTNINELKRLELEGKVVKIPYQKAREELNAVWNGTDRFWTHNGKRYRTLAGSDFHEGVVHRFPRTWRDMNGDEHTSYNKYRLVMFQGKLYWTIISSYYPQEQLYHFEGMDVEPESYAQWTSAKNLRPVYVMGDDGVWEPV